jgi:hypothetical protein
VGFGKAFEFTCLVLHDADKEISGHTRVKGSGFAGDNVNPVFMGEAIFHGRDSSRERLASAWEV